MKEISHLHVSRSVATLFASSYSTMSVTNCLRLYSPRSHPFTTCVMPCSSFISFKCGRPMQGRSGCCWWSVDSERVLRLCSRTFMKFIKVLIYRQTISPAAAQAHTRANKIYIINHKPDNVITAKIYKLIYVFEQLRF